MTGQSFVATTKAGKVCLAIVFEIGRKGMDTGNESEKSKFYYIELVSLNSVIVKLQEPNK